MHMRMKWTWLCTNMTLFTKSCGRSDFACWPYFAEPCDRVRCQIEISFHNFFSSFFVKLLKFFTIIFFQTFLFNQGKAYQKFININEDRKNFHLLCRKKAVTLGRCSDNSYFILLHRMLLSPSPKDLSLCKIICPITSSNVIFPSYLNPDL